MVRFARILRFAGSLTLTSLRATLALRGAFWLQVTFMIVNDVTFFLMWWILFARFHEIGGWRLPDMLTLAWSPRATATRWCSVAARASWRARSWTATSTPTHSAQARALARGGVGQHRLGLGRRAGRRRHGLWLAGRLDLANTRSWLWRSASAR